VSHYVNGRGTKELVEGRAPAPGDLIDPSDLFGWEERTGIAIDAAKGTAADGMLFSTRMLRLKQSPPGDQKLTVGFYAEIGIDDDNSDDAALLKNYIPSAGMKPVLLPFGGEGRRVSLKAVTSPWDWPSVSKVPEAKIGGVATVMLTPAVFDPADGKARGQWWPSDESLGTLIAAAVPPPIAISGWNMASSQPRPIRYAVAPGTTHFWQKNHVSESSEPALRLLGIESEACDNTPQTGIALTMRWEYGLK